MDALAQRLRTERELQQLTVRDVAIVTKIREPYIEAIEAGRYDVLPAIYVRSFIKTLAEALNINRQEIDRLMEVQFDLDGETPDRLPRAITRPQTEPSSIISDAVQRATNAFERPVGAVRDLASSATVREALMGRNGYLYIGSGVLVLAALVYLLVFYSAKKTEEEVVTDAPDVEVSVEGVSGVSEQDSLILTATVIDTAWLTITSDGIRTQQLLLIPDEEYHWSAGKKFTLSVSNAGGVRFSRNGKSLPTFGAQGEAVRSITITKTDIINAPLKPTTTTTVEPIAQPTAKPTTQTTAKPTTTSTAKPTTKPTAAKPRVQRRGTRAEVRSVPLITPAPSRPAIARPPN